MLRTPRRSSQLSKDRVKMKYGKSNGCFASQKPAYQPYRNTHSDRQQSNLALGFFRVLLDVTSLPWVHYPSILGFAAGPIATLGSYGRIGEFHTLWLLLIVQHKRAQNSLR